MCKKIKQNQADCEHCKNLYVIVSDYCAPIICEAFQRTLFDGDQISTYRHERPIVCRYFKADDTINKSK